MYQAKIKTTATEMARSTPDVHSFKVFADEPAELGGQNGAPSPLDYILVAHGSCLNYMTYFIAKEMDIPVEATEITVAGKLDPGKFAGTNMDVRAGYQALEVEIKIKSSAGPESIARLKEAVEARCPVSDNLAAGTPVSISMAAM